MVETIQRERVRRARNYAPGVRPPRTNGNNRGGAARIHKAGRLGGGYRRSGGLRNTRRADLHNVFFGKDNGKDSARPRRGYGTRREMPPYHLGLQSARGLAPKVLGVGKSARALATISRETFLHVFARAIRRGLYEKDRFMGLFQYPERDSAQTDGRRKAPLYTKQSGIARTPGGLRNAGGVEPTSRAAVYDKLEIRGGVLSGEQIEEARA